MRQDLQKLLCEQERNGSSRCYKEVRRKKEFKDLEDPEFNAGVEGMKVRYVRGHGTLAKSFSENFAPLWGIIRKNAGRRWDDVFSELCEVFDMRNHVNAHILVHLWDFVERYTWMEDGEVWTRAGWRGTVPVKDSSCRYYVHPATGILTKNGEGVYRRYRYQAKVDPNVRKISKNLEFRRRDEDAPWFVCKLVLLEYVKPTYEWVSRGPYREGGKIYTYLIPKYPPIDKADAWTGKTVERRGLYYVASYRSASKKDLKTHGIRD